MDRKARRALDDSRHDAAQERTATAAAPTLGLGNQTMAALIARDATKEKPKETKPAELTGPRVVFPDLAVPIESMQWSPGGGGRGEDQPSEITFTSKVGSHSSDLMRKALQGHAQDVEVFHGPLKLKLKGAMVSNYSTSGSGGDKEPTESWTLNFQGIEFEHEGGKKEDEDRRPGRDLYPG